MQPLRWDRIYRSEPGSHGDQEPVVHQFIFYRIDRYILGTVEIIILCFLGVYVSQVEEVVLAFKANTS